MRKKSPIAIIGMSGIFPGAFDTDTFWKNITAKVDTAREVPEHRWIIPGDLVYTQTLSPDKAYSRRACLVDDFQLNTEGMAFDPDLLTDLDLLYHMVLHSGREAISNCSISSIDKKRTGAILAAIALPTDASSSLSRQILGASFEKKLFENSDKNQELIRLISPGQCLSSRVTSLPASLLAKAFSLGAGSFTLDAACASSLYSVKLACDELHSGRADIMLAGGVSRPDCLYTQVGFSQLQTLSPSGRCAPFDKSADGLVVGEGVGILVLKRIEDALRDNDTILSLIHGIGLSNDMGGNLLTPYRSGQLRAMEIAYENAGWSPYDVDLIECHGTGTPVGDREELSSIRDLWGETGWNTDQCAIGSVKSMIGHLLTAAGVAGMIKTILALNHKILPPSLNFSQPSENSPLSGGPFKVQTQAEEWRKRDVGTSRKAAVSSFGFGGVNAHLLLEEWQPESSEQFFVSENIADIKKTDAGEGNDYGKAEIPEETEDIAIVGMASSFGALRDIKEFKETVLKGETGFSERTEFRWKGCENIANDYLGDASLTGAYLEEVSTKIGKFHIPPNEISDMLPQHLLMLNIAASAMTDADIPLTPKKEESCDRSRMGVVIGMGFDFETTNFSFRWNLLNETHRWLEEAGIKLDKSQESLWLETLKDSFCPPLNSSRVVGALGGIMASRIAKMFRFGGPSFVVSCEEASGIKALEIGVRSLQQNETDIFLVGAVDLPGDIRSVITKDRIMPYTREDKILPFEQETDGTMPGEGATSVVLKRLDQAIKDKDRIYAVIKGMGKAYGDAIRIEPESIEPSLKDAYMLSMDRAFKDADVSPTSVSYIETHGSGDPVEDAVEANALFDFYQRQIRNSGIPMVKGPIALGSVKANIGHTGAAAGLVSVVKTSLMLFNEIIPPQKEFLHPRDCVDWQEELFHFPLYPQYWLRDSKDGPRRACVGTMTIDGNVDHVILEGYEYRSNAHIPEKAAVERVQPLGMTNTGLFVVEGNTKTELLEGLDELLQHLRSYSDKDSTVELTARRWFKKKYPRFQSEHAVSLVAGDTVKLGKWIAEAKDAVETGTPKKIIGPDGIKYSPAPVGNQGEIAFVFPGSGNHYMGMGRGIGVVWPEVIRGMDEKSDRLKTQLVPQYYMPWRHSWNKGWEAETYKKIAADSHTMIFGQVTHGGIVADLVKKFGIVPEAVIGYSLGESAGLFAMGAWPERGAMLARMEQSNLFKTELAGPCNAARKVWNVPAGEEVDWRVAAVNRSAESVKKVIKKIQQAYLLIVNTPEECVIGGRGEQVEAAVNMLGCEAVYLEGVVTVHCDAAVPMREAYKELHHFPTNPIEGMRFYSCSRGKSYPLTSENTATSILNQALFGFDFTKTINQAYKDGVRVFLEMGPHSSCTRMITRTLNEKPHLAVSACARGEDDYLTVLKFLGSLAAERVPVNLNKLYGEPLLTVADDQTEKGIKKDRKIALVVGGKPPTPLLPNQYRISPELPEEEYFPETQVEFTGEEPAQYQAQPSVEKIPGKTLESLTESMRDKKESIHPFVGLAEPMANTIGMTSKAHDTFLDFSRQLTNTYAKTLSFQSRMLENLQHMDVGPLTGHMETEEDVGETVKEYQGDVAYTREMCMKFAVGSLADVLGPEFAVVDTYDARVRLPDEPLMLVDRIISVTGEKGSLGSGSLVTEHDVFPGAWYLDGGRAPVCISIEAGQADLFLCSYLGIDLAVKGERNYRLLDAVATFHSGLPKPGDTIRYEINIEKFIRQGDTYLFFFNFNGFIGDRHIISMANGCAGFFTKEEVINSGGIILTREETQQIQGRISEDWEPLVPFTTIESYNDDKIKALRNGDAETCFGPDFRGVSIPESIRLPGGKMKLLDRIIKLDPSGGRYGLGIIQAEADIHPDDWFLTCHFVDDMVMPGTLMYQCCEHTLRVFIQRMGWICDNGSVCYEPVPELGSVLKCRGPVTTETRKVVYEVAIKELGYAPEPYVIADALIYVDGECAVSFLNMSMKMSGITKAELVEFWGKSGIPRQEAPSGEGEKRFYDHDKLLAFAVGKPSEAFGEPYKIFDEERVVARLPGPPYFFMDHVHYLEPEPWVMKPGGWIEARYRVPDDEWYFKANRTDTMAFCILNEIALQPCGFLAAYVGSSLRSKKDLKFRNLGGNATLHREVTKESGDLIMRTRMTKVSEAADIIIEHFEMEVLNNGQMVYEGETTFGFFTKATMSKQVGIREAVKEAYQPTPDELTKGISLNFENDPPVTPDDTAEKSVTGAAMPSKALRMIDKIDAYTPEGGPHGLGFICGSKTVDPDEWFFKAHFYQDPVCPGSLGIESFIQLVKFAALDRWKDLVDSHRIEHVKGKQHSWIYRGQIVPTNKLIEVEAVITEISEEPFPTIMADGYLKVDGLHIYQMINFGLMLVPKYRKQGDDKPQY